MEINRYHGDFGFADDLKDGRLPLPVDYNTLGIGLAYSSRREKPTGLPLFSMEIASRMPATDTRRLSSSGEAAWSTAMKLGRMAESLLRIILTITLNSGLILVRM